MNAQAAKGALTQRQIQIGRGVGQRVENSAVIFDLNLEVAIDDFEPDQDFVNLCIIKAVFHHVGEMLLQRQISGLQRLCRELVITGKFLKCLQQFLLLDGLVDQRDLHN